MLYNHLQAPLLNARLSLYEYHPSALDYSESSDLIPNH